MGDVHVQKNVRSVGFILYAYRRITIRQMSDRLMRPISAAANIVSVVDQPDTHKVKVVESGMFAKSSG